MKGKFNREFEAKIGATLITQSMDGVGIQTFRGMKEFQTKIKAGYYGDGMVDLTPSAVVSPEFIMDYSISANKYGNYNKANNIGGSHYQAPTTVPPYSLMKLILTSYGK